ncbi:MAG TPA: hypothetical protein VFP59_14075 [Candidatus Angelobacter sp.]|nr:hypothetical protein [Candidatus Angelobacter sp.]
MKLFAQLAKIDEARREVWGVATAEVVDKEGEIFDYESSKPYFKSWSDEIAKASDGKSLGNVREMHAPSAVGKLVALEFDDQLRQVRVGAKIVDDTAWQKCKLGVYTGFSIGGSYVKTWKDGEFTRFTANPVEISVVDNPCVPGAHFTAVKTDGSSEVRKFSQKRVALGDMDVSAPACTAEGGCATPASQVQKIGARHSRETLAHLDAIQSALDKMAECHQEAAAHMSALLDSDDEANAAMMARAQFKKDSGDVCPENKTGEQNTMQEKEETQFKAQLEKANANSTSALSKIAEVEKSVAALRGEMESNNQEIQKSLTNLVALLEKLVTVQEPSARVARAAVPTFTVRKEDEARSAGKPAESEKSDKSVHDLLKQALQNPQRASAYLR